MAECVLTTARTRGDPLRIDFSDVPDGLKTTARWRCYKLTAEGKKPPCDSRGRALRDWQLPEHDLSFETALEWLEACEDITGLGFRMGDGWSGLDLDNCRDLVSGEIDPRAGGILLFCPGSYAEVSPSGLGVKIFGRGAEWLELTFRPGKVDFRRAATGYFTVTGRMVQGGGVLDEIPVEAIATMYGMGHQDEDRKPARVLPPVVASGAQNSTLFAEMCGLRRRGYTAGEISGAAWAMVQGGRFPAEAGKANWTRREIDQMSERVESRYPAGGTDFEKGGDGKVKLNTANIRKALEAMGVRPRLNRFKRQAVVEREGREADIDDEVMRRLRFECEESFGWKPGREDFHDVVADSAASDDFHPVKDYLDSLTWDGVARADSWLVRYAAADDSPYVRAVGRLVLVAATRRVRQPGWKFDELMVLESPQGWNKSKLLATLCPRVEWFGEKLVLGSSAKETIENTAGVWITEAQEMVGNKRDVDQLKAFLSTAADGPVRMAYAREPVKVPRQFVVIATTNHGTYLRDQTGGRRFWPVTVRKIDVELLRAERDQLWAEAAVMEARGDSTHLDPSLWAAAGVEQEARFVVDPWEEAIMDALGSNEGDVTTHEIWRIVGMQLDRRTQTDSERVGTVMRRLGFRSLTFRNRSKLVVRGWRRGSTAGSILPEGPL